MMSLKERYKPVSNQIEKVTYVLLNKGSFLRYKRIEIGNLTEIRKKFTKTSKSNIETEIIMIEANARA